MPTEIEIKVMKLLTAIELTPAAGQKIKEWGNEAVTVVAEAALGVYPGLRPKVRTNAAGLLGWIDHPQASETILLLVNDPNQDVAIRAMRAAAARKNAGVVDKLDQLLSQSNTSPILAAEAVKALIAIGTPRAQAVLQSYETAGPDSSPHRASRVVINVIQTKRKV